MRGRITLRGVPAPVSYAATTPVVVDWGWWREVLPMTEKKVDEQVIPEPTWYAVQRIDARLERMEATLSDVRADVAGLKEAVVALQKLEQRVDALQAGLGALERKVDVGFAQVDARFAQIDARFAQVDARLAQLKTELGIQVYKAVGAATAFLTLVVSLLAWFLR